jgi:Tol biopolymer transport system component
MKKTIVLVLVLALVLTMGVAKADFTFGEPINLGQNVNTSSGEGGNGLSISADELSIYFESDRSGGYGNTDLWVATRATKNDDWTESVNLGSVVNGSAQENSPSISADGLSLYFSSNRSGTVGNMDLWVSTREMTIDDWGAPSNLGSVVNSSNADYMSHISADGLSLYFSSERPGGLGNRDLWVSTRATTDDEWGEPVNLGPTVNTSSNERRMWISSDGLMLLLQSDRPKGSGAVDIYMTTRATTNDDWTEPVNIGPPVNVSIISDVSPIVSSDGRTLYFSSYARIGNFGQWDLWQAPIIPMVDLNGDGIVDAADMCIIVDNWGTDNQLCDVGPMPWGDGVVDVEDLIVLAEHLFEEFPLVEPVE